MTFKACIITFGIAGNSLKLLRISFILYIFIPEDVF
jgi:hypothetical protein